MPPCFLHLCRETREPFLQIVFFDLIVPGDYCADLFHTSSNTVDMPPAAPPQHKMSMPLRDTSPTSLALVPSSVRKSRISFNFHDSVCCLTSLPVCLLKFPGVHDCATQGNLSSPEFSICTSGAQCFVSQQLHLLSLLLHLRLHCQDLIFLQLQQVICSLWLLPFHLDTSELIIP